jgi:hypothetical protein
VAPRCALPCRTETCPATPWTGRRGRACPKTPNATQQQQQGAGIMALRGDLLGLGLKASVAEPAHVITRPWTLPPTIRYIGEASGVFSSNGNASSNVAALRSEERRKLPTVEWPFANASAVSASVLFL